MSVVTFHKISEEHKEDGKVKKHEEVIVYGSSGLMMKYYDQLDKVEEKVIVKTSDNKTFKLIKYAGKDNKTENEMPRADILKELKGKKFAFMVAFLENNVKGDIFKSASASSGSGSRDMSRTKRSSLRRTSKKTSKKRQSKRTSKKRASKRTSKK